MNISEISKVTELPDYVKVFVTSADSDLTTANKVRFVGRAAADSKLSLADQVKHNVAAFKKFKPNSKAPSKTTLGNYSQVYAMLIKEGADLSNDALVANVFTAFTRQTTNRELVVAAVKEGKGAKLIRQEFEAGEYKTGESKKPATVPNRDDVIKLIEKVTANVGAYSTEDLALITKAMGLYATAAKAAVKVPATKTVTVNA